MHEDFNDDDDHQDDDYNYDHPSLNPYQWYYKFDVGADTPLSKWINDLFNEFNANITNIPGFPVKKFPVNSWNPNTGGSSLQYLGSNYQGSPIWKTEYFLIDKMNTEYKMHLQSHAKHFLSQPKYYKGLYEILN